MNKTSIEYVDYTWNPIVGCKHGCFYCYARTIADRFNKGDFNPTFHRERLTEPLDLQKPSKILVCSMADMFGDWVDKRFINMILDACKEAPQHTYYFLTKNPKRYVEFFEDISKNSYLGVTITKDTNMHKLKILNFFGSFKTWISFEPLLEDLYFTKLDKKYLEEITFMAIGAMTGKYAKEYQPKKEWILRLKDLGEIAGCEVLIKDNAKKYL